MTARRSAGAVSTLLYAVSLFFAASLLFSVQPMIARRVLPRLGGAPAVWTTCALFFQAALLVGYAAAHALRAVDSTRRSAFISRPWR